MYFLYGDSDLEVDSASFCPISQMFVLYDPGSINETSIPNGFTSKRRDSLHPSRANLDAT